MDRAQPGRFGPTRCGPVYTRSVLILLLPEVLMQIEYFVTAPEEDRASAIGNVH